MACCSVREPTREHWTMKVARQTRASRIYARRKGRIMKRVAVVGVTGSGKTTLSRHLAARLDLPWMELDALHWGPRWTVADSDVFRAEVARSVSGCRWVADGNYSKVRDLVWGRADTLVW